jgi:hypothetical protein
MAGLVPAIHGFLALGAKDVDARDEPGHDGELPQRATWFDTREDALLTKTV